MIPEENMKLRVNGARLKRSLLELGRIGGTKRGGVHRLALTDDDRRARGLLVKWLKGCDLDVRIDQIGNIFGRTKGSHSSPILVGSHIDTQPLGGKFDGAYGVMSALEIVRTLRDGKIKPPRPIEIVSWTNEEGARFSPPLIGSGVFAGKFSPEYAYSLKDNEGNLLVDELKKIGYRGRTLPAPHEKIQSYLELHIEQGPVLEAKTMSIGVVKGILGIVWLEVFIAGESNQAGPTPMDSRKDAILASADMIRAVRNIAQKAGPDVVSTVGLITAAPNSPNTIANRVRFTVDIRSWDEGRVDKALNMLKSDVRAAALREGVSFKIRKIWRARHVQFDSKVISTIRNVAQTFGYKHMDIVSGAGHDAKFLSEICPTGMIFVPSVNGRSHCEDERTNWKDLENGANVLLHSTLALASSA
ncbi:MAG: Zn-dependent hydrolase [Candidatus Bathyarchaeia archaeon]